MKMKIVIGNWYISNLLLADNSDRGGKGFILGCFHLAHDLYVNLAAHYNFSDFIKVACVVKIKLFFYGLILL